MTRKAGASLLRLRWSGRALALMLGGAHAWVAARQQSMNPDGIAYLDMADAYFRGQWDVAINAVWSPLYAWILGALQHLFSPGPSGEFAVVHLTNFLIYGLALACFEYYWAWLWGLRRKRNRELPDSGPSALSEPVWWILGYLIFVWTSLHLIEIWAVTPDMLVAALVYLAAGLLIRNAVADAGKLGHLALGATLGFGYLAKSVMFPLAFLFIAGSVAAGRRLKTAIPRSLLTLATFLLLAIPLVLAISLSKGRLSFGESGRITYLKHVVGVPYPHWRPELTPTLTSPVHPARKVFSRPDAFEFAEPVGGTYPLSYDPSYWYEGVSARLDLRRQAGALIANARYYVELFLAEQGPFLGIVLLLLLMTPGRAFLGHEARAVWITVAISVAAFGLYALVYSEGRYIGPFVTLFWGGCLAFIEAGPTPSQIRLLRRGTQALVVFALIGIAAFNFAGVTRVLSIDVSRFPPAPPSRAEPLAPALKPVELARAVQEMGLEPGDRIAFVGYAFEAYFARLARLKIVAEVPWEEVDSFWSASSQRRDRVLEALAATGAVAVVAERGPDWATTEKWERIDASRHFLRRLRTAGEVPASDPPTGDDLSGEER